jgi:hypothetical protein
VQAENALSLTLARSSRPYGTSGNEEAFVLNASSNPAIEGSRRPQNSRSSTAQESMGSASHSTAARQSEQDIDDLAPLSEREFVNISDKAPTRGTATSTQQHIAGKAQPSLPGRGNAPTPTGRANRKGEQEGRTAVQLEPQASILSRTAILGTPLPVHQKFGRTPPSNTQPSRPGQRPPRPQTARSGPATSDQSRGGAHNQQVDIYLDIFDLADENQNTRQSSIPEPSRIPPNAAKQRTSTSPSNPFPQQISPSSSNHDRYTSSHTRTTSHTVHRPGFVEYPGFPACSSLPTAPLSPGLGLGLEPWTVRLAGAPWTPRIISLPRQTTFTEVSIDYFDSEDSSSNAANVSVDEGLGIINKYYDGWRAAYAEALSGNHDILAVDRARIETNKQKLRTRQDEAIRRLRSGDKDVVKEVMEQVGMDRQMAIDMPREQARWAVPWIREVWEGEHGQITG